MTRKPFAAALCAAACMSSAAFAEDAASPYTLSANVSLVSDYYFRGLTQTWGQPAIQGGFDFGHSSGLFAGTWASNVSGNQFAGGSMEWDFYGGYNYKLNDDITLGASLIYYYYPGASYDKAAAGGADEDYDTLEGALSASWKFLSFKWNYAFTDYFGGNDKTGFQDDTDGTMYFDLTANYPIQAVEGLSIVAHVGYTLYSEKLAAPINGEDDPSYYDWKIGVAKTWTGGWNAGLYYVGASNDDVWADVGSLANSSRRDLNKDTVILQVGRSF